ncbi:MAG: TetR family transcriptional regulator [Balneola sp.]|nr:TetR family transcriptional regulator [Balneola sp.]|tara:strand:+ start:11263 stop:11820 length:558 start_codon:yes stop_codon:yes gene_type:complete
MSTSTREKIIQLGDDLLRRQGFNAFSYADISKPLQIRNAAVHYHFPSKQDLAFAIAQWHKDIFDRFSQKMATKEPKDRLKTFLNFYHSIHLSEKVDIISAFATDWYSLGPNIQTEVQEFTELVIEWLTELIQEGMDLGQFRETQNTRTTALRILSSIFASTQLVRITSDQDFTLVKNSILKELLN